MWALHQEPFGEPQVKLALTDIARVRSIAKSFFDALA
jgi:hypothetical protein